MNTVFASTSSAGAPLFGAFFGLFDGDLQYRGWLAQDWGYRVGLVVLMLVAVAAIGILYAKESGRIGIFRRLMLAGVRVVTLLVIAFLLLRPVWVTEYKGDRRRPIAVLIDASESMNAKDPRPAAED